VAAEHHTTRVTRVRPVRGPAARFTWLRLVRPRRGTGAEFTTSAANPLPDQYAQRHPHAADITSSISVARKPVVDSIHLRQQLLLILIQDAARPSVLDFAL